MESAHLPNSGGGVWASLPEDWAHLTSVARPMIFAAGELLFGEGQVDDHLCLLTEGRVEIIKSLGSPEERRLAICGVGALLGEMSLFSSDGTHTASVRALTAGSAHQWSRTAFDLLLQSRPSLAYGVLRQLCRRLDEGEHVTIRDLHEKNRALSQAYRELDAAQTQLVERERLEHELELARGIQQSMLPLELPHIPSYDLGAMMVPARRVGGDFYDVLPVGPDRLALLVGDVCGKGVPAALFMAQSFSLWRAEAGRNRTPAATLRAVNRHLLSVNRTDMYVTALLAVLDQKEGLLRYARAGHPPLQVVLADGSLARPPRRLGQMLGMFPDLVLDEGSIALPPGSLALMYSDGLTEAFDAEGNEFTPEAVAAVVAGAPGASAQQVCGALWQAVQGRTVEPTEPDDFVVVALQRAGA